MIAQTVETLMERWISEIPESDAEKRYGCVLKQEHTRCVVALSLRLGCLSNLSPENLRLVEAIGWFHDLGRFEQFRRYGTFDDGKSEDHSLLSLKMIQEKQLDAAFSPEERGWIRAAVRMHNWFALPEVLPETTRFFVNLIRDADRLDIYRVFRSYYQQGPKPDSPLELNFPDTGEVNHEILRRILAGESPSYEDAQSVQDMRLIKLSWVYSFQTPGAHQLFLESGILPATQSALPSNPDVATVLETIESYCMKAR